jgi:fructoselysine-6-P-deglycase FrlB-like protein
MSDLENEVLSQPACWLEAAALAPMSGLPERGSRVALVGCGTSFYMAQAIAVWREASGHGESDAFPASEMPVRRAYDTVVVISRSGTTTEVLRLVKALGSQREVVAITGGDASPITALVRREVALPFANERSVVQTRFATSVLALWRAHLGHDVGDLARLAKERLDVPPPDALGTYKQFVFLGQGPGAALANEAALKLREAALAWSEAYPSMEVRHGPISLLEVHSLVWSLGKLPSGLAGEIRASGASLEEWSGDAMVELVRVHRAAIALARVKGLDASQPRHLTRSVVLR